LIKSDLRGIAVQVVARDANDIIAGTAEMRERVERNFNDQSREPLRQSTFTRDSNGEGQNQIGGGDGDIEMQDSCEGGAAASSKRGGSKGDGCDENIDDMLLKRLMPIWEKKEPSSYNFYEKKINEEFEWRKRVKFAEMIKEETNPSTKNLYSEELHQMVRKKLYPTITFPDIPDSDYKTIEEKLRERKDHPNVTQYARAIGVKMADMYRKSYGKDPEYREVGKQHHKKYLDKDYDQCLDQCISEVMREKAKSAFVGAGQSTISSHFMPNAPGKN
jgi:hypothetical protein